MWLGVNWPAVLAVAAVVGCTVVCHRRGWLVARRREPLFPEFDAWCQEQARFDGTLAEIAGLPETRKRVA